MEVGHVGGQNSTTSHCRWGRSHASILLERRAGRPSQTSVAFSPARSRTWVSATIRLSVSWLAGVPGPRALTATLLYRLVAYWLPIPAGGVAYLLFRRRYH